MTIKCPNCGEEISEYAHTCPHCGAENTERKPFSDIDIEGDDYESHYFSYTAAQKKKKDENNKRLTRVVIIIGIVIVVAISVFAINRLIRYNKDWGEVTVIEDTMSTNIIDGQVQMSDEMRDYVHNGVTLFDSISGTLKINTFLTMSSEVLNSITFEARDLTQDKVDIAMDNMKEIYGNPRKTKEWDDGTIAYYWRPLKCDEAYIDITPSINNAYTISIGWRNNNI